MARLNDAGPELAERGWVRAAVDVTGFGLLGHLACHVAGQPRWRGDQLPAACLLIGREVFDLIAAGCIPGGSRDNLAYANEFTEWDRVSDAEKTLLADAQTSGGLLLCVPERRLEAVLKLLKRLKTPCAAVIGRIVRSAKPKIRVGS